MKQILSSLLAAYTLTNGQTTVAPATGAPGTTAASSVAAVSSAPATSAGPAVTASQASASTAPPVIIVDPVVPVIPVIPVISNTAAAVTPAPVTPAPVTPAPVTQAPTTAIPTTAAPTMNPYCPLSGVLVDQHGVQTGNIMSSNQGCLTPFDRAVAFNGKLQCNSYACCQCGEIQCGDPFGLACDELIISDSGAVGNQNIQVLGDMSSAFGGNSFAGIGGAMNNGAQIRCNGLEACKASKIYGKYVGQLSCSGDMGCAGANIRLEDPGNELQVQCNGMMSCMNTNLEIIITASTQIFELGTIEFNGQQSAQGMTITIENQGTNPVLLQNLECHNPTACPNLRINIIGNLMIENCDLQHMNVQTAGPSLLAACQAGNNFNQGGFPGFGGLPQQPQIPQGPVANPGAFNPAPPAQPQPPATGLPPATGGVNPFAFGVIDPQQLTCDRGQCRNRAIRLTPARNFQLKCVQAMQCDGLQLTLDVLGGGFGFGSQIDTLTFSAPTNGATITINGAYVEINDIRCEVMGACNNLKIIGQGIDIYQLNMDCQQPGSCNGCTVNGQDCNMLAMMGGNTGGFGMGFYGNPYAPQQPAAPQQQYPQYPYQWI